MGLRDLALNINLWRQRHGLGNIENLQSRASGMMAGETRAAARSYGGARSTPWQERRASVIAAAQPDINKQQNLQNFDPKQTYADLYANWEANAPGLEQGYHDKFDPYLQELRGLQMPTAPDLGGAYAGMQGLIDQLRQGPDVSGAQSYAALQAGFVDANGAPDVAAYQAWLQQQRPGAPTGGTVTPQQQAYIDSVGRQMREQQVDMVERILGEGASWAGALAAADEINQQVADTRLRFQMEAAEQNFANDLAAMQTFEAAVRSGQVSAEQFLTAQVNTISAALDGYMGQAQLMLQEYGANVEAITAQANIIYQSAMTAMGIETTVMDLMSQEYGQAFAPFWDAYSVFQDQQQEQQANTSMWMDLASALITGIATVAGAIIGSVAGPGGTVAGGAAGFTAGSAIGALFGGTE